MSLIDALRHRLRSLTHPDTHARDLDEELRFHLSLGVMQRERPVGDGTSTEAAFAARRRLGNVTRVKEETRHMTGLGFFDMARQDARFALRTFRRAPGFTAVTVLTLGIGIGANTAIFSAVDTMLFRPLPFKDPSRLIVVNLTVPPRGNEPAQNDMIWSYPKFVVFRDAQTVFSDLALHEEGVTVIRGGHGDAERIYDERVGGGYLPTLGIQPIIGRNFLPDEDRHPGGPRVAILSNAIWTRRFDADSGVVGRTIDLDGSPYAVVGVLGPGFRGMSGLPELWIPLLSLSADEVSRPWWHAYDLIARLRSNVSVDQARAVVARLGRQVDATYPSRINPSAHWGADVRLLDADRVDPAVRRSLLIMLAAVGLVLLIACTNVANLFLVRATGRRREIAVRLAVGAGRARVVRQLLTESLVLSLLGGLTSGAVAWCGVTNDMRVTDDSLPGFYDQILARLATMPGATGAALADWPPLGGGSNRTEIQFHDRVPVPAGSRPKVGVHWVTPSWFASFDVPLERGRVFTSADRAGTPKVVVVNAAAVRAFWPGEDPIGRRVGLGQGGIDTATVVGVVGDVRFATIDSAATPDVYICYAQSPSGRMFGFVKTRGDPDALMASARAAVHEVAPELPVYQMMSMDARVADATSYARFRTLLLGLFALMALALATMGTYGVLSFAVAQRTREIGIRVALGATRAEVMRLVIGQGMRLAAVGVGCGLLSAALATRVLRSPLFEVAPSDPLTFVVIVGVLMLAVVVASWIPARRAASIDPTEALRS